MIRDAAIFTSIIAADRISKIIVSHSMDLHQSIPLVPGFFSLTYARNTGGAFGILAAWDSPLRRFLFLGASTAAIILLLYLYRHAFSGSSPLLRLSLVLISAGAFGNLYDRAAVGEVVDFLDLYVGTWHWPTFNVADSAISAGAALLVWTFITGDADNLMGKRDTDAA
jgi:signal peptidase II